MLKPPFSDEMSKFRQKYGLMKKPSSQHSGQAEGFRDIVHKLAVGTSLAVLPTALGALGGGMLGGPAGSLAGATLGALGTGIAARIGQSTGKKAREKEKQEIDAYLKRMAAKRRVRPGVAPEPELSAGEEEESVQWPLVGDQVMVELPEGSFLGKVLDVKENMISVDLGNGDLVDVDRENLLSPDVDEDLIKRIASEEDALKAIDEVVCHDLLKI